MLRLTNVQGISLESIGGDSIDGEVDLIEIPTFFRLADQKNP